MSRFLDFVVLSIITHLASAGQQSFDSGNYVVEWMPLPATQEIEFKLTVKAAGWVGLGISKENADMKKLDIVVGGFNSKGQHYIWDMYADATSKPTEDAQKDAKFVAGNESNGVTHFGFKRKLDTGDTTKDNAIQVNGSYFMAWAFHTTDDATNPLAAFKYHSKRGYSTATTLVTASAPVTTVSPTTSSNASSVPSTATKTPTGTTGTTQATTTTVASSYSPTVLLLAVAVVAVYALSFM